ncbi:SGNH/GDSL hydrolase family protein [Cyanobium sp. NIES-981]|uniref:SGNH/GDSL hydrolase family protein n=1 Tax=Cyanobium sp. NIES-981 TaxID=1851505 RepID=UPI0007DD29DC|nr:SGNH/GDSL hydrolase family protein [Cyanobium sp. NIES-981]SBO44954.1 conserved protein of unknown function [Cyanobium sp. NIES-981]
MTTSLALFGDSLVDSGNIAALASLVGENPFAGPRYAGGGNVKASDGPVLAEHIAQRLGARISSQERLNLVSLPLKLLTGGVNPSAQLWNYAYAGATSGLRGSRRAGIAGFPLGLRSQVQAFAESAPLRRDRDALIVAGSNDIIDQVARPRRLLRVLRSRSRADDRRLRNRLAGRIAANIEQSVDILTGQGIEETVIVGIAPLSRTPFVRGKAAALGSTLGRRLRRFVDGTARRVNGRLDLLYNNAAVDDDVVAVDGFQVWNSVASPRFLDDVHPTSRASARLADAVVSRIAASAELSSYGFSA